MEKRNRWIEIILVYLMIVVIGGLMTPQSVNAGESETYPGNLNHIIDVDLGVGEDYPLSVGKETFLQIENLYSFSQEQADYLIENLVIESSDSDIIDPATISKDDDMVFDEDISNIIKIYFTPSAEGTVDLTLSLEKDKKSWTVDELEVEDQAKLNKNTVYMATGTNEKLTFKLPASAADQGTNWTSADETIAKVKDGIITGVKDGATTITAENGTYKDTCTVTVITNGFYLNGDYKTGTWLDPENAQWSTTKDASAAIMYYYNGKAVGCMGIKGMSDNTAVVEAGYKDYYQEGSLTAKSDGTATVYYKVNDDIVALKLTITGTGVSVDPNKGLKAVRDPQGDLYVQLLGLDAQNQSYNEVYYENHVSNLVKAKNLKLSFRIGNQHPSNDNNKQLLPNKFAQYEKEQLQSVKIYETSGTELTREVASCQKGFQLDGKPEYLIYEPDVKRGYSAVDMCINLENGTLDYGKNYAIVFDQKMFPPRDPDFPVPLEKKSVYFFTTKQFVSATGLSLDNSISLDIDKTAELKASIQPEDCDQTDLEWTTSDKNIASVDKDGKVTGIKAGTAVITAAIKDTEYKAQCKVTVKEPQLKAVKARVTAIAYNRVALGWDKDNAASGYEIYTAESSRTGFKKLASTSKTTYENKNLPTGSKRYYKVRSYRTANGTTYYGDWSNTVSATPILSPIGGVKAKSAGYNKAEICWNQVKGASGYKIYRAASKNGNYRAIKTVSGNSTFKYTNSKLKPGKSYYYRVKAYRKVGSQTIYTGYSAKVSVKVRPSAPKLTLRTGKRNVKVSWTKVSGANKYELYRAKARNGKFVKIRVTPENNYRDTGLKAKKTYYYKARAYRIVEGKKIYSSYTPVKKIRTK